MTNQVFYAIAQSFILLVILYIQVNGSKFNSSNILLGVKIPEDKVNDEELKLIYSNYKREVAVVGIILTLIFLALGIYKNFFNVKFLLQAIYVLSIFLVYWKYNLKIKKVKERENWESLAVNTRVSDVNYIKDKLKIKNILLWAKIPNLMVLINIIIIGYMYDKLPKSIYNNWSFSDSMGAYVYKSKLSIFNITFAQIFIIILAYLVYYSTARLRMEVHPDNIEGSIQSNKEYINGWSKLLIGNLIIIQLILSYINMSTLGFVSITERLIKLFGIFTFVVVIVNIYFLNILRKKVSIMNIVEKPTSKYYIEDDKFWKLGNSIYYNPDDPAIFIKSRFGPGHTVNVGTVLGKMVVFLGIVVIFAALIIVIYDAL